MQLVCNITLVHVSSCVCWFFRQATKLAGRWHQVLVPLETFNTHILLFFFPSKMPTCDVFWEGDGSFGRRFGRWEEG